MFESNTKFLVVDDFATMRKIIKRVLNDLNFKNVVEADDGKTALQTLESLHSSPEPIKFIISDWNMPNMTGIELLRACRNHPLFNSLPFLMVTAESEQKNIIEAAKSGVSDYVVKPFNAETLKNKLQKIYQKTAK